MTSPSAPPAPAAPPPAIEGPEDFAPAVLWAVATAIADGARTLTAVDRAFGDIWPWDDAALLSSLAGWLRLPQRRLVLLAAGYEEMPRRFPRFVQWRRDWAHAIQPHQAPADLASLLPTALFDDRRVSVARLEDTQGHGRASLEPRTQLHWHDRTDAVLQRSSPGFPVTTLGL
jgi:hypothetical protein